MSQDDADPVVLHRAVSIRTNEPCAFLTIKREHYKLALERTKAVVVRANCGCCIAKRASLTYALAPQQEDIRSLLLSSKLFQGLDPEQVDAFVGGVRSTIGRAAASTCYSPNTASVTTFSGEAREDYQRSRHCKARQTLAWRVLCSPRPLHDCEGQPRRGSLRPRRHCSCCKRCHCCRQRSRHELTATADTAATTTTARAWRRCNQCGLLAAVCSEGYGGPSR